MEVGRVELPSKKFFKIILQE